MISLHHRHDHRSRHDQHLFTGKRDFPARPESLHDGNQPAGSDNRTKHHIDVVRTHHLKNSVKPGKRPAMSRQSGGKLIPHLRLRNACIGTAELFRLLRQRCRIGFRGDADHLHTITQSLRNPAGIPPDRTRRTEDHNPFHTPTPPLLSSRNVTGPSLKIFTFMSAPKRPV